MFRLAEASQRDIFYDLGSGAGQVCVIAVNKFAVKRAVGIEEYIPRVKMARRYMRDIGLEDRIQIRHSRIENARLRDASIVYYGLTEDEAILKKLEKSCSNGCRLMTVSQPLVSVIPNKTDYPFYMMRFPFTKTRSPKKWASAILGRDAGFEELISEFKRHTGFRANIHIVRKLARERFD